MRWIKDGITTLYKKMPTLNGGCTTWSRTGVAKDPSYTPPGVDQDLMYNDQQVQQAYTENQRHPEWGLFLGTLTVIGGAYLVFFVPMFKPRRRRY